MPEFELELELEPELALEPEPEFELELELEPELELELEPAPALELEPESELDPPYGLPPAAAAKFSCWVQALPKSLIAEACLPTMLKAMAPRMATKANIPAYSVKPCPLERPR